MCATGRQHPAEADAHLNRHTLRGGVWHYAVFWYVVHPKLLGRTFLNLHEHSAEALS